MSSILTPQGMVLATAMAVSGTVIILTYRLQKSTLNQLSLLVNAIPPTQSPEALPRSCISASSSSPRSSSSSDGKKKKDKEKKTVRFAPDVVDPTGNSDEYRKNFHSNRGANTSNSSSSSSSSSSNYRGKAKGMPANRIALYNGILRDRGLHRTTYSY